MEERKRYQTFRVSLVLAFVATTGVQLVAAEQPVHQVFAEKPKDLMLHYFQGLAKDLPHRPSPPRDVKEWEARRASIRESIWGSMGDFPRGERPPLDVKITGTIDGGDIVIEKVLYESLPGLFVTALVYSPKEIGRPLPAVLYLNGHWAEAKFTDHIQMTCASLAKMGVVAFCQDVIGTGERAAPPGSPHVTYHGIYRGGVAQIVGRSLFGYEMYECLRAVDYVTSRPDVDAKRILCTGASGGGMQSMYLPALDDRIAASVPVCYISSYQAHMGATACVGEVQRGVLNYTNQWELLGMHAPRPLLCIGATKDVSWFQPALAEEAVRRTRSEIYRLYDKEDVVRTAAFDAPHSYNKEMRELMYNFVAAHLQGIDQPAIKEPVDLVVRKREELTVGWPATSETVPSLTFRAAKSKAESIAPPTDDASWKQTRSGIVRNLRARLFPTRNPKYDVPQPALVRTIPTANCTIEHWTVETEQGVIVPAMLCVPKSGAGPYPAVMVVDEKGKENAFKRGLVDELTKAGNVVLAIDCRGMGETAGTVPVYDNDGLGTEDYNLANYSLTVGRPYVGMLVEDIHLACNLLDRPDVDAKSISLVGRGKGAFAVLLSAIGDDRFQKVVCEELLASYVFPNEFKGIGLSYLIPDILSAGDIEHFVACLAPRRTLIVNPINARHEVLDDRELAKSFPYARKVGELGKQGSSVAIENQNAKIVSKRIAAWLAED